MPMTHIEILRAACCIAGIDGRVCEQERVMLRKLAYNAGAGRASLGAMIERAEKDPNFYEEMFHSLRIDAEASMRALLRTAAADGHISADQRIIMGIFAQRLGMEQDRYDKLVRAVEKQLARRQQTRQDH